MDELPRRKVEIGSTKCPECNGEIPPPLTSGLYAHCSHCGAKLISVLPKKK